MTYTIEFTEYGKKKYDEAMELLGDIRNQSSDIVVVAETSLDSCFSRLRNILMNKDGIDNVLVIDGDFVPGSFSFAFKIDGLIGLCGGIILHGFGETFAVELTSEQYPHWSIHT